MIYTCFVLISFMQRNSLHFSSLNLVCKTRLYTIRISMHEQSHYYPPYISYKLYIYIYVFFSQGNTQDPQHPMLRLEILKMNT